MAADASALNANGQLGSSFGGAYLGQEQAMNNLNSYNAGLASQEQNFQNVLNARNALYSQPISLEQGQNASAVNRALGISNLDAANTANQNNYNMANTQAQNGYDMSAAGMQNNYGLSANANQNQFGLSNYSNQLQNYGLQLQNSTNKTLGAGMLGYGVASLLPWKSIGSGISNMFNSGSGVSGATGGGDGGGSYNPLTNNAGGGNGGIPGGLSLY